MKLTKEQADFCEMAGLSTGFDIDDDLPQLHHLCWPWASGRGALCVTHRLWTRGGPVSEGTEVSCDECIRFLQYTLMDRDPMLISIIGDMGRLSEAVNRTLGAALDVIWAKENPEEALAARTDAARDLQEAQNAEEEISRKLREAEETRVLGGSNR